MGISDVGFFFTWEALFVVVGRIGHWCTINDILHPFFVLGKEDNVAFWSVGSQNIFFRLMHVVKLVTKTRIMQKKTEFF